MFKKISEGVYGEIFTNKKTVKKKFSKNNKGFEYNVHSVVYKIDPKHIVRPIKYNRNTMTLEMNYVDGVVLTKYDGNIKIEKIIIEIIKTLRNIQSKYKTFRHNDLHSDNVMVKSDGTPIMIDFGFANIQKDGLKNPMIINNTYLKNDYGIYPINHYMYDVHFLINSLYLKGDDKIKNMVKKILPSDYVGNKTSKVFNGRFRSNVSHKNFPGMDEIISRLNSK